MNKTSITTNKNNVMFSMQNNPGIHFFAIKKIKNEYRIYSYKILEVKWMHKFSTTLNNMINTWPQFTW